ncbi:MULTISPECIES: DUF4296 domain-containing protein [Tenacibaculum]|uniref:DUF4296 domain-containing protein n=1 Tax=Tenacibaculum mesophilum TaxID=104268 RepID=A0AAE9SIW3_9FLAO|nr:MULTISPECIES: DUF4296 domain-containing protein [Tenacibaculum]KAF9659448.1 DUF4296 domain-containing protein [Tenacibaculum mesophilum]MCO7184416.1 DUF4296 domain-containing protein [Tenacibaculum sp. XPcli2-G]UTD15916.1 DUF4296 domain-containing protein [Tenacibaculum mesophilum]
MKSFFYICIGLFLVSCTSNTIYKKPDNLIPKDSMISLLTDMYIASSAKNQKNKFLKREKNYMFLVYEKYRIDSTRFDASNTYYTSMVDEYTEILNKVKKNIDSLDVLYRKKQEVQDSIKGIKKEGKLKRDTVLDKELLLNDLPKELIKREDREFEKKDLKKIK